jgi:hypothetical protein
MKTRTLATWVFGLAWILALGSAVGQETPGKEAPAPKVPIPEAAAKPAKLPLTGWSFEVARLVQADVEDSITLTFITNSAGTFNLGAEQIITLRDLGVSNELLQAMLAHDQEIASGTRDVFASTAPLPSQVLPFVLAPGAAKAETSDPQVTGVATTPSNLNLVPVTPVESVSAAPVTVSAEDAPVMMPTRVCSRKQAESTEVYRVREPNAVQLTAPILVWKGQGRVPNTMVLVFR